MSRADGVAGSAALGLVSSETSPTNPSSELVSQLDFERRRFGRMRRTILTAARLMVDSWRGSRAKWAMVTLTYRPECDWGPGQMSSFTEAMRAWLKRRGAPCRYVWCFEATQAGRPHYHVLVQLPYGLSLPKPDKQGWWRYGSTRIEWAKAAVNYMAKYASKAGNCLAAFRGARSYGVSGLQSDNRAVLSFWRAPRWVRAAYRFCDGSGAVLETDVRDVVRKVRGGWCWGQTGEVVRSPVVAKWIHGILCFVRRPADAVC